jgi:hypothetical protein
MTNFGAKILHFRETYIFAITCDKKEPQLLSLSLSFSLRALHVDRSSEENDDGVFCFFFFFVVVVVPIFEIETHDATLCLQQQRRDFRPRRRERIREQQQQQQQRSEV